MSPAARIDVAKESVVVCVRAPAGELSDLHERVTAHLAALPGSRGVDADGVIISLREDAA